MYWRAELALLTDCCVIGRPRIGEGSPEKASDTNPAVRSKHDERNFYRPAFPGNASKRRLRHMRANPHGSVSYFRTFHDNSIRQVPSGTQLAAYACGEHTAVDPCGREPDCEVLCEQCAVAEGYSMTVSAVQSGAITTCQDCSRATTSLLHQ